MDVRGAFNAVNPKTLRNEMKKLGLLDNVTAWTYNMTQDRRATPVRGEDKGDKSLDLSYGVPQGSPFSLLVFAMALASTIRTSKDRYAYADDLAAVGLAKTPMEAARIVQENAEDMVRDLKRKALEVEPAKHKFIIF
ncbi:hypothetical protein AOQ84DRAFT_274889, partial [Glonium stellatum]